MTKAVTAGQPAATAGADAIYRKLFDSFNPDKHGRISHWEVLSRLQRSGLQPGDPRIAEALTGLKAADGPARRIDFGQFKALARHDSSLIRRAVEGNLAVPDFPALTSDIDGMYRELIPLRSGTVADYIPQLRRVDPEQLAIAVCTVDGQRFSVGDATTAFCLQSVSKVVNYSLALEEHGTEAVHQHVGREPSGQSFNELALNPEGLPQNPMVNASAIMTTSLIRPGDDIADRFDLVAATWRRLAGGARPGFNNAVYLSERQTADRNFARGYSMRESGAFRPGTDLTQTLEFYFQGCSIEVDAQMLAVAAASLANAGVCPLTEDPVFTPGTVQSCLSLMSSCGMYDFSGEFAFGIGLPAKSGVSGAVMLVIPGLMGICVWSPRLDEHGNSVRGIECLPPACLRLQRARVRLAGHRPGPHRQTRPAAEEEPDPDRSRGRADLGGQPGRSQRGPRPAGHRGRARHRRLRRPHSAAPGRRRRPTGGRQIPAGRRRRRPARGPLGRDTYVRGRA